MKNIKNHILQGFIVGISFLITVFGIISVYSFSWNSTLPNVNSGNILTSSMWNNLISNVNKSIKQDSEILTIDNINGRVGINNSNPGDALTISGGITFSKPWSSIPGATGRTPGGAKCRKIGSLLQLFGYFGDGSLKTVWGDTGIILPQECRPTVGFYYPPGTCWTSAASISCFFSIGTDGHIWVYTNTPINRFSPTGTYPID